MCAWASSGLQYSLFASYCVSISVNVRVRVLICVLVCLRLCIFYYSVILYDCIIVWSIDLFIYMYLLMSLFIRAYVFVSVATCWSFICVRHICQSMNVCYPFCVRLFLCVCRFIYLRVDCSPNDVLMCVSDSMRTNVYDGVLFCMSMLMLASTCVHVNVLLSVQLCVSMFV